MKLRFVNILLLVATVVGAYQAIQSLRILQTVQAEQTRIIAKVGELDITDRKLMHVRALESDGPLQFAWRVYLPAGVSGVVTGNGGGGSSSHGFGDSSDSEFIARVGISQSKAGHIALYQKFGNGSGLHTFGTPEFLAFVIREQHRLQVVRLADKQTQRPAKGETITLLKISMPDDLAAEARQQFTGPTIQGLIPIIFESTIQVR